jgi:DNA-binding CsgD family transcriptional regulator
LRLLSPHLSAAGSLASALDFARLDAAASAFQASGRAVLFLNQAGRVIRLNDAAETLLGKDLQIKNGEILSFSRDATAALGGAIHNLLNTDEVLKAPVVVQLPRRSGRPLIALLSRPSRTMFDAIGRCRCIISLVDLDNSDQLAADVTKAALGLSNAEVRLSNHLFQGLGVKEAAAALGISYETARSSLKTIYGKLNVDGRSELASLVGKIKEHVVSTE